MAGGKTIMVNFKVSEEELAMIKRGADQEGMTQSKYIRTCILRDRFMAGDPTARKNFAENISSYVRATGKAFQDALAQLASPFRDQRKALKAAEKTRGGKSES